MPRISNPRYQKKYKLADLSKWIKGKMASEGISQKEIADKLDITQQALSYKISHNAFDIPDLITILYELKASDEEILKLLKM